MKTKNYFLQLVVAAVLILNMSSCKKPAGPGGKASVTGKVYAFDFDNTFRYHLSQGYSSGENVFIVYGNNAAVGNNVRTNTDGSFEFLYLNKGHYKVFVNSKDTTINMKGNNTEIPIIREFDITDTKQKVTLTDLIINK